jgi:hypothetical protein
MCGAVASAQMQQKGTEEKASPQQHGAGAASKGQSEKGTERSEPKGKSSAQSESREKGTTGAERHQPKEPGTKGSAQTQSKEPATKGSAQTQPKEQGTKGARTQPSETGRKGSAQTEKEQGTKGSARTQQPTDQTTKGASRGGSVGRVQLSEQQRSHLHETILKERNVNRINRANFSINVGTRVPRAVRLAPLPASVLALVPQYRSYHYIVANDEICIVDPRTYEIVDVIPASTQTARGGMARLALTEEEKRIILKNVDLRGDSTLALGSMSEGAPVPHGARLEEFPDSVVQQVPKVRGYKYFTAEDRVAIVDPQASKVQLVIDAKRS